RRRGMIRLDSGFWAAEFPLQPEATFLAGTVVVRDLEAAMALLRAPGFNRRREAILLQGPGARRLDASPFPPGPGPPSLRELSPEQTHIEVDAPHEGFLLTSTHFDPGWRATIDGVPAPMLRADLVAGGLFVPAGKHLVVLRFRPPGFAAGILAFSAAVVGF